MNKPSCFKKKLDNESCHNTCSFSEECYMNENIKIKLPGYDEVEKKVKQVGEDELNPLEKFIYDNEPTGISEETRFRKELQSMLDYVVEHQIKES